MIRKGYSDGPYGQLHWRMLTPSGDLRGPDLYCLHPAPFSGLAFTTIMPFLAQGRRVIAPDFPGHGGSDAYVEQPTIERYAQAMLALINALSGAGAVDVLGFHSGSLVAAELAASTPARVRKLVLIDVPYFDAATRRELRVEPDGHSVVLPDGVGEAQQCGDGCRGQCQWQDNLPEMGRSAHVDLRCGSAPSGPSGEGPDGAARRIRRWRGTGRARGPLVEP